MYNLEEIEEILKRFEELDFTQDKFDKIFVSLEKLKGDAVEANNQDTAKICWFYEKITEIHIFYLNSFYLMKNHDFYKAWCELEKSEKRIQYISDHFQIDNKIDPFLIAFIKEHIEKFQSIYPDYIFTSLRFAIKTTVCSICGKESSLRNHCGHILGEIYNGVRCVRYIKECEPLHYAIVENPKWKYRVLFDTNEKGEKIDNYNYEIIEYLIDLLPSPYVEWDYRWTSKIIPHSKFSNFKEDDECPCGSGKIYKECCLKKDGVIRPHIDFYGFNPIQEPEIEDDFSELKPNRMILASEETEEASKEIILKGISATADSFFID